MCELGGCAGDRNAQYARGSPIKERTTRKQGIESSRQRQQSVCKMERLIATAQHKDILRITEPTVVYNDVNYGYRTIQINAPNKKQKVDKGSDDVRSRTTSVKQLASFVYRGICHLTLLTSPLNSTTVNLGRLVEITSPSNNVDNPYKELVVLSKEDVSSIALTHRYKRPTRCVPRSSQIIGPLTRRWKSN